jgi:hypothetical protein
VDDEGEHQSDHENDDARHELHPRIVVPPGFTGSDPSRQWNAVTPGSMVWCMRRSARWLLGSAAFATVAAGVSLLPFAATGPLKPWGAMYTDWTP